MNGRNVGVVGIVERVGKRIGEWIEAYEQLRKREEELKERLQKICSILEDTKKAKYLIDTAKLQQQQKNYEEELKEVQKKRLKLEWLAVSKIRRGEWDPETLIEYSFVQDLLLLNRIREEQTKEICQNCRECSLIRVKTTSKDFPLEATVGTTRGLPYLPIYKLVEIREKLKEKEMEVKERFLGALSDEERKEIEKRIGEKMVLNRNILNCFLTEKRVPLSEKVVLKHRKYGCHRKLPRWLPIITNTEIDIDGDPKAPDHFVEDITASLGEDGSYSHIYLSQKHGSEETEQ